MYEQGGKRFRRSFYGYNRSAVDSEFGRLIERNESLEGEREGLQAQIDTLNKDRNDLHREQLKLSSDISAMSSQVLDLETSLAHAKSEQETLEREIEAHKAEKNALMFRVDHLKERDRDFALREREFSELQSSISSIMSVTKRASDRLFQKVVDNQENITQIAGDAAREVAAIRADMALVRQQLNEALDEVQDRIDRVDASLTGAVHKLVAIKHDDGLQVGENRPDIIAEVERLLSMRAGEVDNSDGKGYSVPILGPYSAKLISDTAHRVAEGKVNARPTRSELGVKRVSPTNFESSSESISEASLLMERGGMTAEEYYASEQSEPERPAEPMPVPVAAAPEHRSEPAPAPIQASEPITLAVSQPQPQQIGFTPYNEPATITNAVSGNVYYGDYSFGPSSAIGFERYPVRTYTYQPQTAASYTLGAASVSAPMPVHTAKRVTPKATVKRSVVAKRIK